MRQRSQQGERGFAMLLIFAMAAAIAISLYMALPRVAFESQRLKEQTLVDRGESYKRAIQLFVRKNKRWPGSLDDLEKSTNGRFLRQRFKDPMTGKDEWRLIHINNGVLTDSKIKKPGQNKDKKEEPSNFIIAQNFVGSNQQPGAGGARTWDRRRPSEQAGAAGTGNPLPPGSPPPDPNNPSATNGNPPVPPIIPGQPGQPGAPPVGTTNPTIPVIPGLPPSMGRGANIPGNNPAANPANNGGSFIGGSSFIGGGASPSPNANTGSAPANIPGQPTASNSFGGGSQQNGTANNSALDSIRNQLLNPQAGAGGMVGGALVPGGGIAGIASTLEAEGIMVRDEHTKYTEWEFVYDPAKEKIPGQQQLGGAAQQNGNRNSTGTGTGTGTTSGGLFGGSTTSTTGTGSGGGSFIGGSTTSPPPVTTPKP